MTKEKVKTVEKYGLGETVKTHATRVTTLGLRLFALFYIHIFLRSFKTYFGLC
jgi:hypothetical protein